MSGRLHIIYIYTLISIVIVCTIYLSYYGASYYILSLEDRVEHPLHRQLRPSGIFGHGLGILGSSLIVFGVFSYMIRKRVRALSKIGLLKHWLEFHIFLCTLGPIMVLFHTAFKFGGIVSISFWSMVAVVASGVIGRFIYKQIPRTRQGRELSLQEIQELKKNVNSEIAQEDQMIGELSGLENFSYSYKKNNQKLDFFSKLRQQHNDEQIFLKNIREKLNHQSLSQEHKNKMFKLCKEEISFARKIENLETMQRLFKYWHVAHLPFAIIMLVIMIVHIIATMTFA